MALTLPPGDRILRRLEVQQLTGLRRSTLYDLAKRDPTWPRQIRISEGTVGWIESEVKAWLEQRIKASRPDVPQ